MLNNSKLGRMLRKLCPKLKPKCQACFVGKPGANCYLHTIGQTVNITVKAYLACHPNTPALQLPTAIWDQLQAKHSQFSWSSRIKINHPGGRLDRWDSNIGFKTAEANAEER